MKNNLIVLALFSLMTSTVSAQWVQQQTGVTSNFFGVRFTSPMNGWVVGQNGTFMKTTDGGFAWTQAETGLPIATNLNKIYFADSTDGWIVGDYNLILATADGGQSWQQEIDGVPYVSNYYGIFNLKIGGKNNLWISGGRNTNAFTAIEKLSPEGYWAPQIMGFAGRLVRIFFLNDSLGWAVGDSGLILSTTNGGTWWNQQQSHTKLGLNDVMFFDSTTGVCVGTDGLILKTTDGGSNWNEIEPASSDIILFRLALVGDSTAYTVGTSNTIMKSTDRGSTWTRQTDNAPPTTAFEDVYFLNDSTAWAVGHDGVIVHLSGGGLSSVNSGSPAPYSFNLGQNYPNPFNPTTVISYSLPQSSFVTLTVYNAIGEKVRTLVDQEQSAGVHTVELDASNLSSGIYFYRLQSGQYTGTKKLVLVK